MEVLRRAFDIEGFLEGKVIIKCDSNYIYKVENNNVLEKCLDPLLPCEDWDYCYDGVNQMMENIYVKYKDIDN